ncbi:TetR/AcrR family transcriptional regulator [Kitasatospora sp. NPDC056076]|uniref:TetR/AcrR family transcriptional regulator n=1 Tax=Kitasatospora sp. NPDC056076 TaxID=3345703 RepID=UPI0035DB5E6A
MGAEQTRKKILTAFLALAGEQGMAAITTKEIATAAGVNEVTLFRHFGDKANLALEAVKAFSPAAQIDAFEPKIDASSPETTIEGLLACVHELRHHLEGRAEVMQFGMSEATRYPELLEEIKKNPMAARRMLTRAFHQAAPQLRPGVDIDAEVLGLLGTQLLTTMWSARGWGELVPGEADRLVTARLRLIMREGPSNPEPAARCDGVSTAGTSGGL